MTGWQDTFFTVKPWKTILIEHFCKWFQRVIYGSTRIPDCLIFRQLKREFKQSLFASLGGKSINTRPGDHWVPEKLPWIVMLASKLQQAEPVRPAKQLHACCRDAEAESLSRVITGIFFYEAHQNETPGRKTEITDQREQTRWWDWKLGCIMRQKSHKEHERNRRKSENTRVHVYDRGQLKESSMGKFQFWNIYPHAREHQLLTTKKTTSLCKETQNHIRTKPWSHLG